VAEPSLIDDYLDALDRRLRGPARAKHELLTEAGDGLRDTVEAYLQAGLPLREAERRAVTDFGPLGRIAREYQAELTVAHGMHTVRSLLLAIPVLHGLWLLAGWLSGGFAEDLGPVTPEWYELASQARNMTVCAVIAGAVAVLLFHRYLVRLVGDTRRTGLLVAAFAVGALGVCVFADLAFLVVAVHLVPVQFWLSPPLVAASMVTVYVLVRFCGMARDCLVVAR